MKDKITEYSAISIFAKYKNNTLCGASRYAVQFVEPDGCIRGPYTVAGSMMDYWRISRGQNFGHRWKIETRTTKGGREVIKKIEREA